MALLKTADLLHRRILSHLANGERWSEKALVEREGCSLEALNEALGLLVERNIPITNHGRQNDGWQLTHPVELLQAQEIGGYLSTPSRQRLECLEVLDDVDSTNTYLLHLAPRGYWACFGELQRAGRGRRGRHWISPYALNIYFSLGCRWHKPLEEVQGLSIAVGVAAVRALNTLGLEAKLKWPNDIQYHQQKLGGILIETTRVEGGDTLLVVGIGLNVHRRHRQALASIEPPWTSLEVALDRRVNRNQTAGLLLDELLQGLEHFTVSGLKTFHASWHERDALQGLEVSARSSQGEVIGVVEGIDKKGALRLRTDATTVLIISSGEVSLRPL